MFIHQIVQAASGTCVIGLFFAGAFVALPTPVQATDIAWHSKSEHVVQHGANSERNGTIDFKTGERGSVLAYSTTHAEVNGMRPWVGISVIRFDDLSSIIVKSEGKFDPTLHVSTGSGEILFGTGRFEGITGKFNAIGKYSSHETVETDWSGSYSLPNK